MIEEGRQPVAFAAGSVLVVKNGELFSVARVTDNELLPRAASNDFPQLSFDVFLQVVDSTMIQYSHTF